MFKWFTNIKETIKTVILKLSAFHEFFDDPEGFKSMTRLLSFMVIGTICFEGIWSLAVLKIAWALGADKVGLAGLVLGSKYGSDYIVAKLNQVMGTNNTDAKKP